MATRIAIEIAKGGGEATSHFVSYLLRHSNFQRSSNDANVK